MISSTIFILFYIANTFDTSERWDDESCSGCNVPVNNRPIQSIAQCDQQMIFDLTFEDQPLTINIIRDEYTISSEETISYLTATDMEDKLVSFTGTYFEFHSPSEHKIDGIQYDMEMQIYHYLDDGFDSESEVAVVSIFFKVDKKLPQPFFDDYYFRILRNQNQSILSINFNQTLGSQLSNQPNYFTYLGSETSIRKQNLLNNCLACDENIQWFILTQYLPITQNQLNEFQQFFKNNETNQTGNAREIQNQNGRIIKMKGDQCISHIGHDFLLFLVYCAVIFVIYRSI